VQFAVAYLAAAVTMLVIDLAWLGIIASGFYREQLGPLMADEINWTAGLAFYALYILGVVIFVIQPALAEGSLKTAAMYGFLFGLVAYATYDLANLATMKGFPWKLAMVDMAWGAVLTSVVATVGTLAARNWG
jgi:uncharacterized membrane protein